MTSDTPRLRLGVLGIVAVSLFAALFARLWFLQVMTSPDYEALASANTLRTVNIEAPRGRILDRNEKVIVGNERSIVVSIDFQAYARLTGADQERLVNRLATEITRDKPFEPPVTAESIRERLDDPRYDHFKPVPIAQDLSPEMWVYLEEHMSEFPTVSVDRVEVRSYQFGPLLAHVLGYVGSINSDELHRYQNDDRPYSNDSEIGKAGVELTFENLLRGVPGQVVYEVDPRNKPVREVSRTEPVPGYDIYLTVDMDLQALTERSLATELFNTRSFSAPAPAGSSVVLDPRNGQVLAMASFPTYNPSDFVGGISQPKFDALTAEERYRPFTNRATGEQYAAGSTFKLITSYAGLRSGLLNPSETYNDRGTYTLDPCSGQQCTFRSPGGVGIVNLEAAITRSSDPYFYRLGDLFWQNTAQYGRTPMQDAAHAFGFGKETGVPLGVETAGNVPTPDRRRERNEQDPEDFPEANWYTGDNIQMSIGQGELGVTPLQLANAYATFANGGTRWKPSLLLKVNDAYSPNTVLAPGPEELGQVELPPEWREPLLRGFEGVTTDPRGTASGAFDEFPQDRFRVAGKTGTAEIGRGRADTSLFVGFGPSRDPAYVAVAVMEQAGFGSEVAAPVVRDIFEPVAVGALPAAPLGGFPLDPDGRPIIPAETTDPPPPPPAPPPPALPATRPADG